MNKELFKPLYEQIAVVQLKNKEITNEEFENATKDIIFRKNILNLTESIEIATEDDTLTEGKLWGKLRWKAWRRKLNKLTYEYDNNQDAIDKAKILEKVKKLQKKLATHGYDYKVKYVDEVDALEKQQAASN